MSVLRSIVERVGGDISGNGREAFVPGPGHSRKDRGVHLTEMPGGRILWNSFHGDNADPRAMFEYLGLQPADERKPTKAEWVAEKNRRDAEQRIHEARDLRFCQDVWSGTAPLADTVAATYLWSRGLASDNLPDLRFHPSAPRSKPREPGDDRPAPLPFAAMVALVRSSTGAPRAIHATYINPEGKKAFGDRSRLMFGPMSGCSVQLGQIGHDGVLAVGEGIETCGSFAILKGVPCWATLSTSGICNFVVPSSVKRLLIAADHDDEKGFGLKAASVLAQRAKAQCDVEIHPAPKGFDWNDVLQGEAT